jgi:tRNA A-37 threonylcarbamoyl transferase component Bud32
VSSVALQPYVIGQWVRGEKFYGRAELIEEILHGPRNWLWLLGTRRVGKTSLLKQIEYLTNKKPELGYFPLFWDFQGAENSEELHMGFNDALLDAEERLEALGIDPSEIENDDMFRSISKLRRAIKGKNLKLMLLCDEVEELIELNKKQPSLLRKLRRAMQSSEDVRSVLASTIRLWALADQRGDPSPFLHGFSPPLYIHALSDDDARALIRQINLPTESRPRFDDEAAEVIRTHCDNHPYLIQLVSKRYVDLGNLEDAVEQVATDPMVSYFFSVDFEMLSDSERRIIRLIAERDASTSESIQQDLPLETDSLIRRNEQRRFVLVNYFFRRWFKEQPQKKLEVSDENLRPMLEWGLDSGDSTTDNDATQAMFGGRYELLQEAGRGATGVVYRAHDNVMKVDIALKMLRPEIASDEEVLERFRKEIVLTLDINHPNVLPMYHLGDENGRRYLTMKWIDGGTLAEEISANGALPISRVISVSRKLASALEALHAKDVLHRDVKPQNIMIDRSHEPYLTDFGLVRLVGGQGMTRDGVFLGTPNYASPEQASLRRTEQRSDLYSLGLIIYEMATARRTFTADSAGEILELHREKAPPDPRELRPDLPEELAELILRCLEKDPDRRYPTAAALGDALDSIAARSHG